MSSVDQANDGSLAGILEQVFRSYMMKIDGMLPVKVVSYDDAKNRVTVKPLIKMLAADGNHIERQTLTNIPVFRFGGGGFFIRFPIKAGGFGWIIAADRDISLMMQRGGLPDIPNTERMKSFSDALFLPDTLKDWSTSNPRALTIQSMDGGTAIEVSSGLVKIKAGAVEIESDKLTHNGINIGETHIHGGVSTGNGKTQVPE